MNHFVSGQDKRNPDRGLVSSGSYALSNIETINTTNGNLMLDIPIATLPAGRGPGYSLNLRYNSKIWNTDSTWLTDGINNETGQPQYYSRDVIQESSEGGWQFSSFYRIEVISRYDFEPVPDCGITTPDYQKSFYQWKLKMHFPDGSTHDFRPAAKEDFYLDGYFNVDANGRTYTGNSSGCISSTQTTTSGMTYYSTDGSYLRLVVDYVAGNDGPLAAGNPWTLYLPDGSKVTSPVGYGAKVYDRNGNWGGVAPDIFGRGVTVETDVSDNTKQYVRQSGVGGSLVTTTIKWKTIWVKRTYDTAPGVIYCYSWRHNEALSKQLSVIDYIELPAEAGSLRYTFGYNGLSSPPGSGDTPGWGELNSIQLPSGAVVTYQYALDAPGNLPGTENLMRNSPTRKVLTYGLEYIGGASQATETWLYNLSGSESVITSPDGSQSRQYFGEVWQNNTQFKGKVFKQIEADGTKIERVFQNNRPEAVYYPSEINSYVKTEYTSIMSGSSYTQTAIKDYTYDKNGNITEVAEYDFVPYSSVHDGSDNVTTIQYLTPKRRIKTVYFNDTPEASTTNYTDPDSYHVGSNKRLLRLPFSVTVLDGNQVTKSRTEMQYDFMNYDFGNVIAGNPKQSRTWDSAKGAVSNPLTDGINGNSVLTTATYNSFGMPLTSTDAKGAVTTLTYGSVSGYYDLYPTQTIVASNFSIGRTSSSVYDFYTGLVTTATDNDNSLSTINEYDPLGRLKKVRRGAGTTLELCTTTQYDDAARRVIVRSDLYDDKKQVSIQHYDRMGRVRLSRTLEDANPQGETDETQGIKVETRYLLTGAACTFDAAKVCSSQITSNPFRSNYAIYAGSEPTMGWTISQGVNTGRHSETETFSGASLPKPFVTSGFNTASTGRVLTDIDAERTLVTDQAGKQRISKSNGLGQLMSVWEVRDNDTQTVPVSFPNTSIAYGYQTNYTYDTLSNLTNVSQGSQAQRTFSYNSLSRLLTASNPESGVIGYKYDDNGNLRVKTDARGVSTHFAYDALNRVTRRWYNGSAAVEEELNNSPILPPGVGATNEAKFDYDTGLYGKGQLAASSTGNYSGSTWNAVTTNEYLNRDRLGRPQLYRQSLAAGGSTLYYDVGYAYNLSGGVMNLTYPSGDTVSYDYDSVGRLSSFQGNLGYGSTRTYANGFQYNAFGAISREYFAGMTSPLFRKTDFNSRGQMTETGLSTDGVNINGGKIVNDYGTTANNGNVQNQKIYVAGGTFFQQNYTYDLLNRLKSVTEKLNGSGGDSFNQTFDYDRYGNRTINAAATMNAPEPQFDTNQMATANRLYSPGENIYGACASPTTTTRLMCYDQSGNLIRDKYVTNAAWMTYDAENKMSRHNVNDVQDDTIIYTYDADGKRKSAYIGTTTTYYIHGLGGELLYETQGKSITEYGYRNGELLVTAKSASRTTDTRWLVTDHLGTPRIVADQTGNLAAVKRHDYLPFGEEIGSTTGGRNTTQGYAAPQSDGVRQQFTSYERDIESELDFAQARYYNPMHGRFTAVDPLRESAKTDDPQSWNRYVYVLNRPLNLVDPTGESPSTHIDENGKVITVIRDGDLGVYQHGNNANGKKPTEYMITKRSQNQGPSAGGKKIGETEYEDEFITPENGKVMTDTVIQVGATFDRTIQGKKDETKGMTLDQIAAESGPGKKLDIKKDFPNAGALLDGKYATSRSAGNFLAGYNAQGAKLPYVGGTVSFETFQKLAGAVQVLGRAPQATEVPGILVKPYGQAPTYGEYEYQRRMSYKGYHHVPRGQ